MVVIVGVTVIEYCPAVASSGPVHGVEPLYHCITPPYPPPPTAVSVTAVPAQIGLPGFAVIVGVPGTKFTVTVTETQVELQPGFSIRA